MSSTTINSSIGYSYEFWVYNLNSPLAHCIKIKVHAAFFIPIFRRKNLVFISATQIEGYDHKPYNFSLLTQNWLIGYLKIFIKQDIDIYSTFS